MEAEMAEEAHARLAAGHGRGAAPGERHRVDLKEIHARETGSAAILR